MIVLLDELVLHGQPYHLDSSKHTKPVSTCDIQRSKHSYWRCGHRQTNVQTNAQQRADTHCNHGHLPVEDSPPHKDASPLSCTHPADHGIPGGKENDRKNTSQKINECLDLHDEYNYSGKPFF